MNVDNCTIVQVSLCDAIGLPLLILGDFPFLHKYLCMCQLESSLVCDAPLSHQIFVNIQSFCIC